MTATFLNHSFPETSCRESPFANFSREVGVSSAPFSGPGLILAPEVVEWTTPVSIGSLSPIRILQQRICFTELHRSELPAHAERFGPYAIEFDVTTLRRSGALPVIYMPQALSEHDHLALLGPFIVSHLGHIERTLRSLNDLHQLTDLDYVRKRFPGAEHFADDCMFNLANGDVQRGVIQESQARIA